MALYRKRPVVVEAVRVSDLFEVSKPSEPWVLVGYANGHLQQIGDSAIEIRTPEGVMRAGLSDYLIRGVKGEYYPCKADVFEQTYEQL